MFSFVFLLPVSALAIRDFTFMGRSFSAAHRLSHRLLLFLELRFLLLLSIYNIGCCWFFSSLFVLLSSLVLCEFFLHHGHRLRHSKGILLGGRSGPDNICRDTI
ncbi:hypothetical protein BDV11DRAFT_189301 [Aspergillus similis]